MGKIKTIQHKRIKPLILMQQMCWYYCLSTKGKKSPTAIFCETSPKRRRKSGQQNKKIDNKAFYLDIKFDLVTPSIDLYKQLRRHFFPELVFRFKNSLFVRIIVATVTNKTERTTKLSIILCSGLVLSLSEETRT